MESDSRARPFLERDAHPDPLAQFRAWFEDARRDGAAVPEAMALATASGAGAPSVRMVLLKGADEGGFVFFTGRESRKGRDLAENPRAALLFHWPGRQVRIEGAVGELERSESEEYFHSRPRGSQLAAWTGRQSEVIAGRDGLDARFAELDALHPGDVPLPPAWGGYRVVPESYEFWQHRDNRLHDRLRYRRGPDGWIVERLSP